MVINYLKHILISRKNKEAGKAVISLIFFMTISMAIITAVVVIVLNSATSASNLEQGTISYYGAESGAENALLRLIRDPNYTGETLSIDQGTVTIQVNGGTITSTANIANSIRKIQVQTLYNNNVLTITSWNEIN